MTRAVPILVLLCVLAFVVILAGCGGTGAPDGATMDTAKKPTPPASTPCRLLCSKRISLEPLASDSFTMYSNGTDVQMLNVGSSGPGDWAPSGQRVVLFRDGLLYTARPDGTDLTPFTTNTEPELPVGTADASPEWSPDGGAVVFYRHTNNAAPSGVREARICVKRLDGTAQELTSGYTDRWPSWSPDGDYLVFDRFGAATNAENGLYVVPAAGGTPVPLVLEGGSTPLGGGHPDWGRTADGQLRVLFVLTGLHSVPVDAHGTVTGPVHTYAGTGNGMYYPSWSPDGTQFAFHIESYKGNKLIFSTCIYTLSSNSYVKVGDGGFPAWSPPIFGEQ